MAFLLTNLLQRACREMGMLQSYKATAGSTTTFVNTGFLDLFADDDLKDFTAFVVRDAGGAGAAPEGQFGAVTAYNSTTYTGTIDTTLTAAIASGDIIGLAKSMIPLQTMIQNANDALTSLGYIPLVDTVSLTGTAGVTEYTWAVAWKKQPPIRIDVQGVAGNSSDNEWVRINEWEVEPATAGSTGKIILNAYTGRAIRVWYLAPHPSVYAYSDPIIETIDPELAAAALVERNYNWLVGLYSGSNDAMKQEWNKANQKLMDARALYEIWRPKKTLKGMPVPGPDLPHYGDTRGWYP